MHVRESQALWKQLVELDKNSEESLPILTKILYSRPEVKRLGQLQGAEGTAFIDCLDQLLSSGNLDRKLFKRCLTVLRKTCGRCEILPTSWLLCEGLENTDDCPFDSGGFGNVWMGTYNGCQVAIKELRIYAKNGPAKVRKRFYKEAIVWKYLSHPNLLPFIGISPKMFQFCMVSNWMSHGNILEYVRTQPDANRLGLLSDVGRGLQYLHDIDFVHGDLKGANILIDDAHHACLADFGLTTFHFDPETVCALTTSMSAGAGTVRWMAPELLLPQIYGLEHSKPSKQSDIYAFGMVVFEVLTGNEPFHKYACPAVILQVMDGIRPERPSAPGFSDHVWDLVEACWHADPLARLDASVVLNRLRQAAMALEGKTSLNLESFSPIDPFPKLNGSVLTRLDVDVSTLLHRLRNAPHNSSECLVVINFILPHAEELMGEDAQYFIDVLDEAASLVQKDLPLFRKLLHALRQICGLRGMLPSSYLLLGALATCYGMSAASPGILEGTYGHTAVAFKISRRSRRDEGEAIERFCKEVVVWKRLSCMHSNIVPLLGVMSINPRSVVSEWMMYGDMLHYVCSHPDTDRLQLLKDICEGLKFLHSFEIVHADLKGHNILIDSNGRARLKGFSLVFITHNPNSIPSPTIPSFPGGTHRYMPPELLVLEGPRPTPSMKGDIYSLAMVIVELFTGQVPFHELPDTPAIMAVMKGKRPPRPIEALTLGLSDPIWHLVETCWQPDKDKRPTISSVLDQLNGACANGRRSESLTTRILRFARHPQNSYVLVILLGLLIAATWRH